jgi:hypothetical protein
MARSAIAVREKRHPRRLARLERHYRSSSEATAAGDRYVEYSVLDRA